MKNDVVPVEIRGILPANSGCAIFVGNEQKVFVIQVEHNMGAVIGMFLRDTPKNDRSRTISWRVFSKVSTSTSNAPSSRS
jgi:hypothetical protein